MVAAVVRRSPAATPEPRDGALLTTELQELNSKAAIATMKAAVLAAAGTAVVAVLTRETQTVHSWVVGAVVADLAMSPYSGTATPTQEVVHHRAE
jgi:hypothetical protein